jgi:mannose-6-phosphate isomerase-like protein (cupin superfamily)
VKRLLHRSIIGTLQVAAALAVTHRVSAQTHACPRVAYLGATQLRALTDSLAEAATRQPGRQLPGRLLGRDSAFTMFLLRRDTSSRPELHEEVGEVFVIQAGRATIVSGGRMQGAGLMEPGEWNGGQIVPDTVRGVEGAADPLIRRSAGPGDVVVIPAGLPHQVEVAQGESVTYLVLKTRNTAPALRGRASVDPGGHLTRTCR